MTDPERGHRGAKVAAKKELTELAKAIETMQKRLDKGDYLSKKEVSSLAKRLGVVTSKVVDAASW